MKQKKAQPCHPVFYILRPKSYVLCLMSCVLCFVFCVLCLASLSFASIDPPAYSPGAVIVKFSSDNKTEINSFLEQSGAYSINHAFPASQACQRLSNIYVLEFSPGADVALMARQYEKYPIVEYAQPNYVNHLCSESSGKLNDLFYESQWALQAIDAPKAWKIEKGSPDVVIAVIDTGVDYNHEDLKPRIWTNPGEVENNGIDDDGNGYIDDIRGWDFADSPYLPSKDDHLVRDNDPMDEKGHGTHVAGIIAAVPDNSNGVAGITWNCRIMALRGGGDALEDDDLSAAIVYAADNGARIINMSWGSEELSYIIRDATEYAYSRGCALVAAAGNENLPVAIYPAIHKHVIAVGATDRWDKKAFFSNYGPSVDIVAPGLRIFSTVLNDKYSDYSGTSMATPVVSGVIALMLSKRPGLTTEEVYQILRSSADKIDEPLFPGIGRVNAAKALMASSPLIARIILPDNGAAYDKELNIRGTADGSRFRGFQLEYSIMSNMPYADNIDITQNNAEKMDWKPVCPFRGAAVFDELLGIWSVAHFDEGGYVLRLRVLGDGNMEAEDKVILNIDHSPPNITELHVMPRVQDDICRYLVKWRTDDPAFGELYYRTSGSEFQRLTSATITREHIIYASDNIPPGNYEYYIAATNMAGFSTIDDNNDSYYPLEIKTIRIASEEFAAVNTYIPSIHPVRAAVDFDGDGQTEILGMEDTKSDYDTVKIYEEDENSGYHEVFASDINYYPWDVGDTDEDGLLEILGDRRGLTFLYESPSQGEYPTKKIWEVEDEWGGRIADMDMDGRKEIVSRHLNTGEIWIYENRGNNSYLRADRLKNPTKGNNYLSATFAISDFDGDGRSELVAGDLDGDLFIYENVDNDMYSHTWTGAVPHSYIRYVNAGDFDGDGMDEFVVGARVEEPHVSTNRRWIYTIFDCSGRDEYEAVWSREFLGFKNSEGAVSSGDMDNDNRDEIAILVTPNIYIFRYFAREIYEPVWHHSAASTRWPIMADLDVCDGNCLLFNYEDKLTASKWISPVPRPWGLIATPLGETVVELRWNGPPDARFYKIYRGTDGGHLRLIATLNLTNYPAIEDDRENWEVIMEPQANLGVFRDGGLTSGTTYWYSVSSVSMADQESELSNKVSAVPNPPPRLLSAEYIPPSAIRLTFNEPMGPSAQDESRYMITSGNGFNDLPSSAVLNGKVVILTLEDLRQGIYNIAASGVRDATGVPISENENTATFQVKAPDIHDWTDLSHITIYPNPVMPDSRHPGRVTFDNLPPDTTIRIYTCNGQLVRSLDEIGTPRSKIIWYLDNHQHRGVAGGIYIYIAECIGDRKIGKLAVIR